MIQDPALRQIIAYILIALVVFGVVTAIVLQQRRKRRRRNYHRHDRDY